ncbi:unnamed protein product, partial [Prorocentrum cordatum]
EMDGDELQGRDRSMYRSISMRIQCLVQGRLDIPRAAMGAARAMQWPKVGGLQAAKRIGRYLIGKAKLLAKCAQQADRRVAFCTDRELVGCVRTRKWTLSCAARIGQTWIRGNSTTQGFNSLPAVEVKFHALTTGANIGLGLKILARDAGADLEVILMCDVAAGK